MTLERLCQTYPWSRYSRKLTQKIHRPSFVGSFSQEEAEQRGMHLATGQEGYLDEGNAVAFYLLVDPEDGVIADAKFQVYGNSALIGAAEVLCELLLRKNYDQARRIGADLIDQHVQDRGRGEAFPVETFPHINLVIAAVDQACAQCTDLPLPEAYTAPPAPMELQNLEEGEGYPGFEELSLEKKKGLLEQILDADIRPYVALDGGGVDIKSIQGNLVTIAYAGNCTSCFASTGATLSYIQQVIRARAHPSLVVEPDMEQMAVW